MNNNRLTAVGYKMSQDIKGISDEYQKYIGWT